MVKIEKTSENPLITIFTPTYNRGHLLSKLYNSLCEQTYGDFEWLVVDDGSTDDTKEIVSSFSIQNSKFKISYYYQNNSGKHIAINKGALLARGKYFFIVDSDDALLPDAIFLISKWISEIEDMEACGSKKKYAGVSGLRIKPNGNIIGNIITEDYIDAKNIDRPRLKLLGDKAEIYKTDIIRKFKFPQFEGEKFLAENVCYDQVALAGFYVRWYMTPIYLCEYLPDGLTDSIEKLRINNYKGFICSTRYALQEKGLKNKIWWIYVFYRISNKKNISLKEAASKIGVGKIQMLFCCLVCKLYEKKTGKYLM